MSKHTPEPWAYDNEFIVDASDNYLADCAGSDFSVEQDRYNAQRIVACVNAMAGIEDPGAFMEVVKQLELDAAERIMSENKELKERLLETSEALEKYCHLAQLVIIVREAQIAYFANRTQDNLIVSKQLEKQLDNILKKINQ